MKTRRIMQDFAFYIPFGEINTEEEKPDIKPINC